MALNVVSQSLPNTAPNPIPGLYKSRLTGVIVLVLEQDSRDLYGTVLQQGKSPYSVGHYSEDWTKEYFEPYYGSITLTQDFK